MTFSPDGRLLASGNSDGYVRLWNPATGKLAGKPLPAALPVSIVNGVAFSPDGKLLASADGDGYVKLWNPATSKQIGGPMAANPNSGGVNSVAFSSETGLLASGEDNGTIQLWDAAAERPVGATLHINGAVQFSPQASLLTSDADGYVRNTHVVSSGNFFVVNPTQAFSPEGKVFAVPNSNTVQVQNKERTKIIPAASGADNSVGAIALSLNGKLLAASDDNGHVGLWETATGKPTGVSLSADKNGVGSMAFSPDGKILAVGGLDGYISLWNPVTGLPIRTRISADASSNNTINEIAFSPDSKVLASASHDGKVRLWDSESGRLLGTLAPGSPAPGSPAKDQHAEALAFSPKSSLLAVEYSDKTIQLWNTHTYSPVGVPLPPNSTSTNAGTVNLTTLQFSGDGSLLMSADFNGDTFEVTPWEVWQYTNPYAALCDEAGAPTKAIWEQYSSGLREPSGICAGVPPASALHG